MQIELLFSYVIYQQVANTLKKNISANSPVSVNSPRVHSFYSIQIERSIHQK